MRFLELYLKAYGPFTDRVLDLSAGREGLHVVFGPNEAGKSSALRAVSAFLFGIHGQTRDDFVHPYKDLRIGARLQDAQGNPIVLWRRKGTKDTLRDGDEGTTTDAPVDEAVLQGLLGGINVSVFEDGFGLNHERLVAGGRILAEGGGELGESLFAAGLGTARLRKMLLQLEAECGSLFKGGAAKKPEIDALIATYRERTKRVRESSLASKDWTGHREAVERAQAELARLTAEYEKGRTELSRLERMARALPKLAQRNAFLEKLRALESLGQVPVLRTGFEEEQSKAASTREGSRVRLETAEAEVSALQKQLEALDVPEGVLARSAEIETLHQEIAAHQKAARDRLGLESRQRQHEASARDRRRALHPGADPETTAPPELSVEERKTIQILADQRALLASLQDTAQQALTRSRQAFEALTRDLEARETPRDTSMLRRRCQRARQAGDLEAQRRALRASTDEALRTAVAAAMGLGFDGASPTHASQEGWEALETVEASRVPTAATVDRFEKAWDDLRARRDHARAQAVTCREQVRLLESKLADLELEGAVPTVDDLLDARRRREEGWRLVRRAWLEREAIDEKAYDEERPLPEAYEEAVRGADTVADDLRTHAGRVAAKAQHGARRDEQHAHAEELRGELEALEQAQTDLEAAWREAWTETGVEPLSPREMRGWLARHEKLVDGIRALRSHVADLASIEADIEGHRAAVLRELEALGDDVAAVRDDSLARVLDHAEARVALAEKAAHELDELRERRVGKEEELHLASADLERAGAGLETWETAWGKALTPLSMGVDTTPEAARAVLDVLTALADDRREALGYAARIASIDEDADLWRRQIREVAEDVAPQLASGEPETTIRALQERAREAIAAQLERTRLEEALRQRHDEEAGARRAMTEAARRLEDLCREAGVRTPEALPATMERAREVETLRQRISTIEEELLRDGKGASLTRLEEETEGLDGDALDAQIRTLRRDVDELDGLRTQASTRLGAVRQVLDSLEGTADAAEHAEAAAAEASKIQTASERYVRLTLARAILRREIERYRATNQGPLMDRASRIFAKLTRGAYTALASDYLEGDRPVLLAVRAGVKGGRLPMDALSEGTREQLYLALRLASIEHHLESGTAIPLIVDDLLLRSDEARSTAVLDTLADLSKRTQVLFFTHQARYVELAESLGRDADVFVQRLDAPSVGS